MLLKRALLCGVMDRHGRTLTGLHQQPNLTATQEGLDMLTKIALKCVPLVEMGSVAFGLTGHVRLSGSLSVQSPLTALFLTLLDPFHLHHLPRLIHLALAAASVIPPARSLPQTFAHQRKHGELHMSMTWHTQAALMGVTIVSVAATLDATLGVPRHGMMAPMVDEIAVFDVI